MSICKFLFLKNVFLSPLLLWLFYLSLIWQVQMYDKTKLKKDYPFLTLVLLSPNISVVFESTVHPNQGPSDEAI